MKEILPGYFYVPIPEGATNVRIIGNNHQCINCKVIKSGREEYEVIDLPFPASFTILFTRDEATEEKWKGVVPGPMLFDEQLEVWYDYTDVMDMGWDTATESGASLLRSHNLPQDNFVIIKNYDN